MSEPAPLEPETILEVRLIGDEMHCVVANPFEDPAEWGVVLAYLTRVVAQKCHEHEDRDPGAVVRAIRDAFIQELASPQGEEGPNG